MTSIQLTEDHKAKLLEMCKVLFPEYKYWKLHDGSCDSCTENTLDYSLEEKPQWNSWDRIHWFEFCIVHIPDKLLQVAKKLEKTHILDYELDGRLIDSCYESHPVTYLYNQFLKLNS